MKQIIKPVFRGLFPFVIVCVMMLLGNNHTRPLLVSETVDFVARLGIALYYASMSWALGEAINGETKRSMERIAEIFPYPTFHWVWGVIGFLAISASVVGFGMITYKVIWFFFPKWAEWRYPIVGLTTVVIGWGVYAFYVDWLKWYREY